MACVGEGWYQNVEEVMDVMTITDDDDVGGGALGGEGTRRHCHRQWVTRGCDTHSRCLLHKKPDFTKKGFQVTLHEPQVSHIESAEGR